MTAPEAAPAGTGPVSFASDAEVRWCPGCGDFSILKQFRTVLAELETPRENHVVVSGIGCASRLPYYVETYGIHGIHGRAPALATGLKATRPELTVWVVTGDGDALSIGASHLLHALRRNVDIKILLFNNQVYGLTKGQHSPTSPRGQVSRTLADGVRDEPLDAVRLALAAGASFVARALDRDTAGLREVLRCAAAHRGAALVEIYQNCPVFNDGAFAGSHFATLAQGQPITGAGGALAFGADLAPRWVPLADQSVYRHDETADNQALLSRLGGRDWPVPLGVFRAVDTPVYGATSRVRRERSVSDLLAAWCPVP